MHLTKVTRPFFCLSRTGTQLRPLWPTPASSGRVPAPPATATSYGHPPARRHQASVHRIRAVRPSSVSLVRVRTAAGMADTSVKRPGSGPTSYCHQLRPPARPPPPSQRAPNPSCPPFFCLSRTGPNCGRYGRHQRQAGDPPVRGGGCRLFRMAR